MQAENYYTTSGLHVYGGVFYVGSDPVASALDSFWCGSPTLMKVFEKNPILRRELLHKIAKALK